MGREVRRVPFDFDWPLNKIWEGFVNPHYKKCENCDGRSVLPEHTALERIVQLIMVAGEDSLCRPPDYQGHPTLVLNGRRRWPHPYLIEAGINDPGASFHQLSNGLAGRDPEFMGYDAVGRWAAMKKILQVAGLPEDWGVCPVCKGEGMDPAVTEVYEAWEPTPPPAGQGWQLWETVSEGSPVSPVFKTEAAFIAYLIQQGYSEKSAQAFVKHGYAPSFVMMGGQFMDGIEASGVLGGDKE